MIVRLEWTLRLDGSDCVKTSKTKRMAPKTDKVRTNIRQPMGIPTNTTTNKTQQRNKVRQRRNTISVLATKSPRDKQQN